MPEAPFDWDPRKAASNVAKHGVPFEAIYAFDWETARRAEDDRYDYGETRYRAIGMIEDRAHVVVYTLQENTIRLISLRKANAREIR